VLTAGKVDDIAVLMGNVVIAEAILKPIPRAASAVWLTRLLTLQQPSDVELASNNKFAADLSLINFQKI
jgi:hypothetical protein